MVQKILAALCIGSLLFVIGTAGALETMSIGIGQALFQMVAGFAAFAGSARALIKAEKRKRRLLKGDVFYEVSHK